LKPIQWRFVNDLRARSERQEMKTDISLIAHQHTGDNLSQSPSNSCDESNPKIKRMVGKISHCGANPMNSKPYQPHLERNRKTSF
jgi:hypothetical protein